MVGLVDFRLDEVVESRVEDNSVAEEIGGDSTVGNDVFSEPFEVREEEKPVDRADREEELCAPRRPSLKFGVGDAKIRDKFPETDVVADTESSLVVLGDDPRPGILTGKHVDGRGFEEDHNGVDQGAS